jgi:hypothetical protein
LKSIVIVKEVSFKFDVISNFPSKQKRLWMVLVGTTSMNGYQTKTIKAFS